MVGIRFERECDGTQFVRGIGEARQQREFGAVNTLRLRLDRRFSGRPRVATPSADAIVTGLSLSASVACVR